VKNDCEPMLRTVLLVDDDDDPRFLIKIFLSNFGYEVDSVSSTLAALAHFNPAFHDLVLTDNSMPTMTGSECGTRYQTAISKHAGYYVHRASSGRLLFD
jgi:CheY-like chemotaxis protein